MRMPTPTLLCSLAAASLLAACGQREPKTVAHYTANPAEREAVLAECKNNPGKLKDDPDCINASDSLIQGWGKATLPPFSYTPKPSASAASN